MIVNRIPQNNKKEKDALQDNRKEKDARDITGSTFKQISLKAPLIMLKQPSQGYGFTDDCFNLFGRVQSFHAKEFGRDLNSHEYYWV